jgi:hypothetical protein
MVISPTVLQTNSFIAFGMNELTGDKISRIAFSSLAQE